MNINLKAYLIFAACSVAACAAWLFIEARRKGDSRRSAAFALLTAVLGVVLGIAGARIVWVLCRINYRPPIFQLRYNELSYYGGVAGVIAAVCLAAKLTGRNPREALNSFAPAGALAAALFRFAEVFLGDFGAGQWMEEGIFFPVTIEIRWDPEYSEFFLAVFMLEGACSLAAMVFALLHRKDRFLWVRTLFYLCLPQVLCESLRNTSISWLFVRVEQLFCFLFCEGVLVWYAYRIGWRCLRSWYPAMTGLAVCGVIIAAEFALDGKITVGDHLIPVWIIYGVILAGLAAMAWQECRNYRAAEKGLPD